MKLTNYLALFFLIATYGISQSQSLDHLNLPRGFSISVFAEVENARSLAKSPNGTIFVGNRSEDKVYALQDTDNDGVADKKYIIASGLVTPNGVAFKNGDLYVAEVSRILKFPKIESRLSNPPSPVVVYDKFPKDKHHGWKYIAFGPDGKLYVPVGAPCNICEKDNKIYASITRINDDGSGLEIVANGVRNSVGFDWNPDTKELWFTDNGRDMMGDNYPPCELNKLTKDGQHFGYPYCHGGDFGDPEFGSKFHCSEFEPPAYKFKAHVAPLGLKFYTGTMFPKDYQGDVIVAQHGSWNRSKKIGYRLMRVKIENNKAVSSEVFIDGWLDVDKQEAIGRPVDVLQLKDGSLLVSDDYAGKVYRISYGK
ncbi:MAG: sorbosone dehydrogenase family protein [Cyclobacteriaceae bacterium]|nr:sorbosone dehydrogenase family protein [Cyclobacteriaceae bacterium]